MARKTKKSLRATARRQQDPVGFGQETEIHSEPEEQDCLDPDWVDDGESDDDDEHKDAIGSLYSLFHKDKGFEATDVQFLYDLPFQQLTDPRESEES